MAWSALKLQKDILTQPMRQMSAWCLHSVGSKAALEYVDNLPCPPIQRPRDLLIKVKAFSINPIDVRMKDGYANAIVNFVKNMEDCWSFEARQPFPLILGRDFSGVVEAVGPAVRKFKPGDKVYGSCGLHKCGSFAERVVNCESSVAKMPNSTDFIQAASFPFVVNSCWIPLMCFGALRQSYESQRKRVFINGASGGIGTFAIQLCKAYNAYVVGSCSTDLVEFIKDLGADVAIDYSDPNACDQLKRVEKFDIVLNLAAGSLAETALSLLNEKSGSAYVTLVSPLVRNVDADGFASGLLKSAVDFTGSFLKFASRRHVYSWSFVWPDGKALEAVASMVDSKKIKPVIAKTFSFAQTPEAVLQQSVGHNRGKIVVHMKDD